MNSTLFDDVIKSVSFPPSDRARPLISFRAENTADAERLFKLKAITCQVATSLSALIHLKPPLDHQKVSTSLIYFSFFFFFNEINCCSRRAVGSVVRFPPFDAGGFLPGRRVYTGAAPRWAVSF